MSSLLCCCDGCRCQTQSTQPLRVNTTTVEDPSGTPSPTVAPYALLTNQATVPIDCRLAGFTCGGETDPPCPPWPPASRNACAGGDTEIQDNCYTPAGTQEVVECQPLAGWKAVQARKQWQGAAPIGVRDTGEYCGTSCQRPSDSDSYCAIEPVHLTPPGVRYRTAQRTVEWLESTEVFTPTPSSTVQSATLDWSVTVDRTSGQPTGTGAWSNVQGADAPAEQAAKDCVYSMFERASYNCGLFLCDPTTVDSLSHLGGLSWYLAVYWCLANRSLEEVFPGHYGTVTMTETPTEVDLLIDISKDFLDGYGSRTQRSRRRFRVQLSDAYTSADVKADLEAMLDTWRLSDDVQLPWRTDATCSVNPMVIYHESQTDPLTIVPDDPDALTYDNSGFGYSGALLGAPKDRDGAYHFDWDHITFDYCPSDPQNYAWRVGAWAGGGDYQDDSDTLMPETVTRWTNQVEAGGMIPGAFLQCDGTVVTAQKWCEIIPPRPRHNWFRPCGADRYAFDEAHVGCITDDASWPTITVENPDGDPGFSVGDTVLISGSNSGVYQITGGGSTVYTVGAKLHDFPAGYSLPSGTCGKVRWPAAWALCGAVAVTDATPTTPIQITVAEATWLRTGDSVTIAGVGGNTAADGTWTITRVSSTEFTLDGSVGSEAYTAGGTIQSAGAPSAAWATTAPTGSYHYLTWLHNFRDVAEQARYAAAYASYVAAGDAECLACIPEPDATPIRPYQAANGMPQSVVAVTSACGTLHYTDPGSRVCRPVVCFSPNGETFSNGVTVDFPSTFPLDDRYGSLWQAAVSELVDPLWQYPHVPCNAFEDELFVLFAEDQVGDCNGTTTAGGEYYFAHRPIEESVCAVPAGAPALPEGASPVNVLTSEADLNAPSPPAGRIIAPPVAVGMVEEHPHPCSGAVFTWLYQAGCVCGSGPFAAAYEAQGVVCEEFPI